MQLKRKSAEVYVVEEDISTISKKEIDLLKDAVSQTALGRVRVNLHPHVDDTLHEMFIVIKKDSYVRPHKHPNKSEAFHIVYGSAKVIIFNDDGSIRQIVELEANSQKPFYYRMSKPYFHTLIIESEILIVHEITNGPFRQGETLFASFAPEEQDAAGVLKFQNKLRDQLSVQECQ